jgi:hypothetical protein
MSRRFTVKFKTGPIAGQSYSVGPGEYFFIGSAETCAIRIADDPTISPTHACIYHDPSGAIRFKDMGSQFGTFRNGKKLEKSVELKPGDRITLGQTATFQSSWWNALQATRFTRFSMIKEPLVPSVSNNLWYKKSPVRIGALILFAFGAIYVGVDLSRHDQTQNVASSKSEPDKPKERNTRPADMGIFSGRLSAKLFNSKPKRVAKQSIELTPERQFIWDEIVSISRRFGDPPPSAMDPGFVREVERHLRRFTKGDFHKVMLSRKTIHWPTIEATLTSKGLPVELGYIVWVESNFQTDAQSPVGAMGPWQFMPETAKEYGLAIDGTNDERKNLQKSSVAAASYFSELLRMFGTERYLLAIASYNTGQNRVKRFQIASTVNKEKSVDFWQLRHALPKETAEYVPKFMAAVIIGRNPSRWDLSH